MVGGFAEIKQGEIVLAGILVDARAAAHYLLELGHGAHFTVKDYEAAGLGINSGREQARGGDDDRVFCFRVNKVAELGAAVRIITGDSHDIALVFLDHISVFIDKCLAHYCGMLGVHAENNGLLKTVIAFF